MMITPLALAGVVQNMDPAADHAEWYAQDVAYQRATAEALVEAIGAERVLPELPDPVPKPIDSIFELLAANLAGEHRAGAPDDYARYRLDLARRLLAHLRNEARFGGALDAAEREDIGALLGRSFDSREDADAALERALRADAAGDRDADFASYLLRRAVRQEYRWQGALGVGENAVFQRLAGPAATRAGERHQP